MSTASLPVRHVLDAWFGNTETVSSRARQRGVSGGELRQSRHAGAQRTCLAEVRLRICWRALSGKTRRCRSFERTRPYVDPTRVAVWGWSGGGTDTLNLMFRSPDLYKVGMAVAPVPDQRLYDRIYQERYMGLPQHNVEGYREGSRHQLRRGPERHLLIVHGSGDDNVHFQGTGCWSTG